MENNNKPLPKTSTERMREHRARLKSQEVKSIGFMLPDHTMTALRQLSAYSGLSQSEVIQRLAHKEVEALLASFTTQEERDLFVDGGAKREAPQRVDTRTDSLFDNAMEESQ
jgi:hypothetical protein